MSKQEAYIPGVCNINPKEVQKREKAGYFGVGVFLALLVLLMLIQAPVYTRALLFLPAFIGAIGFLQARNKFCVGYAAAGQQNANDGSDSASEISSKDDIATDKTRARTINMQALGLAVAATLLTLLLP